MVRWLKLGRIYCPKSRHPQLASHAANPLAVHLEGDIYRIFFNGRDLCNRSSIGFVDCDIESRKIVHESDRPAFEFGPEGSFYSHGVSLGNSYEANGTRYVMFMGWNRLSRQNWRGEIGRLVVGPDLALGHIQTWPVLPIDASDRMSLSYPWVMEAVGGGFHMWYGSTISRDIGNGEMLHVIKYATSMDGDHWCRKGIAVPYKVGEAQAFSRPTVVRDSDGCYHMWFSYRGGVGQTYRIGYAFSSDARKWELRLEDAGIDVSNACWDSEMIEYPFVFEHKGRRYMLYNGNGYGKTGFGLAIQEE